MLDFIKEVGFPAIALLLGGMMVIVAIIRNITLEKAKIQLTPSQSIQLAVVGVLFIVGGFVLQYFPPGSPEKEPVEAEVYSTLYALQTQVAQPTQGSTERAAVLPSSSPEIPLTSTMPANPFGNTTPTPIPFTLTPDADPQSSAELFCTNFYSIRVREGPNDNYPVHSVIENPNNLSNPDCLMFDFRMPDNSWIRIAPDQENPNYAQHELGWVTSEQFRPIDFENLQVYVPDEVKDGLYCVATRYGVKVRACPNEGCREIGYLSLQDCLYMDGRSADDQWVRIAANQKNDKYKSYEGHWVSTYYLAPFDFSAGYQPYFRYYFELLPPVEQVPTPNG